jgi:hypothetical protein
MYFICFVAIAAFYFMDIPLFQLTDTETKTGTLLSKVFLSLQNTFKAF